MKTRNFLIKLNNLTSLNYKWAFVIIVPFLLAVNLTQSSYTFYHDSLGYWILKDTFIVDGNFSFLNFDKLYPGFRAYLFPFINYLISLLAIKIGIQDYLAYEVIMSIFYGTFLTIIVPDLIWKLFERKPNIIQTLLFGFLAIFFWRGSLFYPLSDLLSFSFLVFGSYFAVLSQNYWLLAFFAGIFWGGATHIRPIYQITLLPVLIWIIIFYITRKGLNFKKVLLRLSMLMLGFLTVYSPQLAINIDHYGIASPFVQTQKLLGIDAYTYQLVAGIWYQKYETNIGTSYPVPTVFFLDSHGEQILIDAGLKSEPYSVDGKLGPDHEINRSEYFSLLLKYPLDFAVIFLRHLFNGLDITYNSTYVKNIFEASLFLRILNYTIWFLVLTFAAKKIHIRKDPAFIPPIFMVLIFSLPSILAIPIGVEVRYMLSFHFLAYGFVSFWVLPDFQGNAIFSDGANGFLYVLKYITFVSVSLLLSINTFMNLQYGHYLLKDTHVEPVAISCEENILAEPDLININGKQRPFLISDWLSIKKDTYYQISLVADSQNYNEQGFYVDLFGAGYDNVDQDRIFQLKKGNHVYSAVIYSGAEDLPADVYFRLISVSREPFIVNNINVYECRPVNLWFGWKYYIIMKNWLYSNWQLTQPLRMPIIVSEMAEPLK